MKPFLRHRGFHAVGALVWRYGATALLLGTCVLMIALYLIRGDRPRAMTPPDGYVAEESRVFLAWTAGEGGAKYRVVVARDGDFSKPVFDRTLSRKSVALPRLEPDALYCWKILPDGAGVSCFRTSPHVVPYGALFPAQRKKPAASK